MKKLILIFTIVGLFYIVSCSDLGGEPDISTFIDMARNAHCADITNRLFLIDNEFVFWNRRGGCADASYAYVLFGKTVEETICYDSDSVAGPASSCDPVHEQMFQTILENLEERDLGLGEHHVVREISF